MNKPISPLVWVGIGIAGMGLGTGNNKLVIVGALLALGGYVGKKRILAELPPGLQKQLALAEEDARAAAGEVTTAIAPGAYEPPLQDMLLWE